MKVTSNVYVVLLMLVLLRQESIWMLLNLMGEIIKETASLTKEDDSIGCAKLVVFCNAPDDNPFMAGAFHGVTEADADY